MIELNRNLGLSDEERNLTRLSAYKSHLYEAEASSLIGEVMIGIQEGLLTNRIRNARPGKMGRASDGMVAAFNIWNVYQANYRHRVETLRDLIVEELSSEGLTYDHNAFEVNNGDDEHRVRNDITRAITELARLAAEL